MVILGVIVFSIILLLIGIIFLIATIIHGFRRKHAGKTFGASGIILTFFTVIFLGIPILFYTFIITVNEENRRDNEQKDEGIYREENYTDAIEDAKKVTFANEDYVWYYIPLTNWEQDETDEIYLGNLNDNSNSIQELLDFYENIKDGYTDISDQFTIDIDDLERRGGLQKTGSNGDMDASIDFVEYKGTYYVDLPMVVDVTKLATGLSEETIDVYPIPDELSEYIGELLGD